MSWDYINKNITLAERRAMATKHGFKYHPLYRVHTSMMSRCYKEWSHNYKRYGARGIKVCPEWHDPATFCRWGLSNGYVVGLFLDREDNDKDYSPSNCRWVTALVSARNRSSTKLTLAGAAVVKDLALRGIPQKLIGALYGITFQAVSDIKYGKCWPEAESLFIPLESK